MILRDKLILALVFACLILWGHSRFFSSDDATAMNTAIRADASHVIVGGERVAITIAATNATRERGLSGHAPLADHEGMLFVFDQDAYEGFWMKDMHFAIDMLWLAKDGTVVYMQQNVAPDTYPQVFRPDTPARYVLELPANFAHAYHVQVGDKVELP